MGAQAAGAARMGGRPPPMPAHWRPFTPLLPTRPSGTLPALRAQEVTDEQGRRRFHGAFTGGFSAGYFNTVGSKVGCRWWGEDG
jgi:G patch domain-containing protein 1